MYAPYLVSRQCKAPNYSQAWDTGQKPSFMPRPGELGSTSCLLPCRCQSLAFGAGSWQSYPKPCPNLTSKINRVPLGSNIPCNQHWPGQARPSLADSLTLTWPNLILTHLWAASPMGDCSKGGGGSACGPSASRFLQGAGPPPPPVVQSIHNSHTSPSGSQPRCC